VIFLLQAFVIIAFPAILRRLTRVKGIMPLVTLQDRGRRRPGSLAQILSPRLFAPMVLMALASTAVAMPLARLALAKTGERRPIAEPAPVTLPGRQT
jgi:hypothetical protein